MPPSDPPRDAQRRQFASTHWSLVLQAGRDSSPHSERALAALCESYWYPLYAYVRRQGYSSVDAQDLTQGFFARLLEKQDLANVRREKGRFRAFLLASLKHFLINEWDKARTAKRGGGRVGFSLDFDAAESRYAFEPSHARTAESIFDREWALTMLEKVRGRLAEECASADRRRHDRLCTYLTDSGDSPSYREVAEQLEMTEGAVKVAVHRLRRRFRELLREQIGQTIADGEDVEDEIRALFAALHG